MRSKLPLLNGLAVVIFAISLVLGRWEGAAYEQKAIPQVYADNIQYNTPKPSSLPTDHERALQAFFARYSCPIGKYSNLFTRLSDLYSLDYRLLPAISFRESTCDKYKTDNNALGFGRYQFDSQTAIVYVAQAISGEGTIDAKYYRSAQKDPEKILRIYNARPSYTSEVLAIMGEIK